MKLFMQRLALFVAMMVGLGTVCSCASVPRMQKEALRKMLDNPDVIVVDVRQPRYRNKSGQRIKGAICEDPYNVEDWIRKYPKEKTIVFYCA
ncbi:MAG: hypothetical protein JRI80_10270 [Deltaproteobacteria bacterium]|nr:hypothetical protein [Deltaproteobacteria bacterium]